MTSNKTRKAVIVGAGPVGCLAALAMAHQGWTIEVYESRPDLRLAASKANIGRRSINLAMSARGLKALETIHPAASERFINTAVPMKGRMIHTEDSTSNAQLYDQDGQCINSIDRALLNESLLDELAASPNIRLFFRHKIQSIDFDSKSMTVQSDESKTPLLVDFDFCIGADGSYSIVRRQLMRTARIDFEQNYIPHDYVELHMPAKKDESGVAQYAIDPNFLHIWPRHSFMLIALPNKYDKSFTCTLFAPTDVLVALQARASLLEWFRKHFPDALELIGEETLATDFARNPISPLISTKTRPYHYKDRAIIIGDAAHSMVPFYGQGLNCGLEDVRVLDLYLRQEQVTPEAKNGVDENLAKALQRYSDSRHDDLVAIGELAMKNYVEMRHSVTTWTYLIRKGLDDVLYFVTRFGGRMQHQRQQRATDDLSKPHGALIPRTQDVVRPQSGLRPALPFATPSSWTWIPLYTMVTFRPDISYATARRKAARQAYIFDVAFGLLFPGLLVGSLAWTFRRRLLGA